MVGVLVSDKDSRKGLDVTQAVVLGGEVTDIDQDGGVVFFDMKAAVGVFGYYHVVSVANHLLQ